MKNDYLLKIYSVIMALFLWGFVIARGQSGITLEVPVEFENIPAGLMITEGSNTSVRVSVQGHERLLRQLGVRDLSVTASLATIQKGENSYLLRHEDIKLPPALKVSGLSPTMLHLRAEETMSKNVPVMAAITGLPAEGYAVRKITLTPSKVTLEGARSALGKVHLLYTRPVDIMSATADIESVAELNITGLAVTPVEKAVTVSVTITKETK